MATYKVSYVVTGDDHPGGIVNLDYQPNAGDIIEVGTFGLEVVEIFELIPPRGEFFYLHATCKIISS